MLELALALWWISLARKACSIGARTPPIEKHESWSAAIAAAFSHHSLTDLIEAIRLGRPLPFTPSGPLPVLLPWARRP